MCPFGCGRGHLAFLSIIFYGPVCAFRFVSFVAGTRSPHTSILAGKAASAADRNGLVGRHRGTRNPSARLASRVLHSAWKRQTISQVELRDTFAFESHSVRHRMSPDLYLFFGAQRILEVLGPNKSKAGFSATGRGSEFAGRAAKCAEIGAFLVVSLTIMTCWRRGGDSNPRYSF